MPVRNAALSQLPLVVTSDPQLLDDLLRLAAAGNCEVRVALDAAAARPMWAQAPFALLGIDAVDECVRGGLSGPPPVVVVARHDGAPPQWRLAAALCAEQVVTLPAAQSWLVDRFADHATGRPTRARVIGVLGGCGGAGASVLAAALAVTARRHGLDTLLIDADPLGGGIDLVLGWERVDGLRWPDLADARGRVDPPALVNALPSEGGLAALSFDRNGSTAVPVDAMAAALDAGRRGRDIVVVDLPRRLDEAAMLALASADHGYLVVPTQLRGFAAARRTAVAASHQCPSLAVVVRASGRGGPPARRIASALDLPFAGRLHSEAGLPRRLASGEPPATTGRGPLASLCRCLLADIRPRAHRAVTR